MTGQSTDCYVKWTLSGGGGTVEVTATLDANGNVVISYALADGSAPADINGVFFDWGNDGGSLSNLGKGINMNGSAEDGTKLDGFDYAVKTGDTGLKDGANTGGTFTIAKSMLGAGMLDANGNVDLAKLAETQIGIRATSTGWDQEGSLKLVATGEVCEPPPPQDDFPEWAQDISNVILVFNQTLGDTKPRPDGDGYYTVKIDNWPGEGDDDLDNSIDDILAWLITNDQFITGDSDLLGVIIKGGIQPTNFYAYGVHNTNGTAADDAPAGLGLSWDGSSNPQPANAVDASYDYAIVL